MPIPRSNTAGLGVVLYLAGVAMFAVNDALGKWLVADYGVGQLMLLRTIGAGVVLAPHAPFAARQADRFPPTRAAGSACPVRSRGHLRFLLRDAHDAARRRHDLLYGDAAHHHGASAPLLGEKVERFRWIAVLVGFVGVLIALRPSPQMFSWGAPIALFGAISYALSQTITRDLRGIHWAPLVLWQFVGSGLIGAATIPWSWTTPSLV